MKENELELIETNKSSISKEEDKTLDNYEKFLMEVRLNMSKCKYRKVLEDLQTKQGVFSTIKDCWKLNELRIRCILKIVNRKLYKYENNQQKMKSVENWLIKVENDIDEWFDNIGKEEQDQEQIEIIVQLLLEFFYSSAILNKNQKQIGDSIGYLAIAEKVIKAYIEIARDPKTLNLAQRIYLFLSSMLIVDLDFDTAKSYQSSSLKLSFKELFYRIDIEDGLNIESFNRVNVHYLNKLFVNIIIAFYQRGVCEENNGNYPRAAEAYKQAKWFTIKFLKNHIPELAQFISDIEERSINYAKVFLKSNGINFELKSLDNKDNLNNNVNLIKGNKMYSNNDSATAILEENMSSYNFEFLRKKYEKNIELIENLKFPEFETDIKKGDDKIKDILYTVKTVDNLMSFKFKNLVNKMNNLDIHKLNKEAVEMIQRRINDVKAEENYIKNFEKKKSMTRGKSASENIKSLQFIDTLGNTTNDFQQLYVKENNNKEINQEQNILLQELVTPEKALEFITKNTENFPNKQKENMSMKKSKSQLDLTTKSKIFKKDLEKTERFSYDFFISNKNFQKKLSHLNLVSHKELKFQKKMLKLKKNEINTIPDLNVHNIENTHKSNLLVRMKNGIKNLNYNEEMNQKKNEDIVYQKKKMERQKDKLEFKMMKSLDKKAFNELKNFSRKQSEPKIKLREEFMIKSNPQNDYMRIILENNDILSKINKDIEFYDYIKNENMKAINPLKFREKKLVKRKPISDNFLPHKSMEHFIKYDKSLSSTKNQSKNNFSSSNMFNHKNNI
jgi:hypothetical protein